METSARPCILVVDDSPFERRALRSILEAEGYIVVEARDGDHARDCSAEVKPDLVLLDIIMPGPDGFETCRRLKSMEATAETPVVFVTSKSSYKDKVKGFAAGGTDYITKPFDPQEVVARVHTHLSIAKALRKVRESNVRLETSLADLAQRLMLTERSAAFDAVTQGIIRSMNVPLGRITGSTVLGLMDIELIHDIEQAHPTSKLADNELLFTDISSQLEAVEDAAGRLVSLVRYLTGKNLTDRTLDKKSMDFSALAAKEIELLAVEPRFRFFADKHIRIHPGPLPVNGVPSIIAQVMHSAIITMIDHIHTRLEPSLVIETGHDDADAWLRIQISGLRPVADERPLGEKPDGPLIPSSPYGTGQPDTPEHTLRVWEELINAQNGTITLSADTNDTSEALTVTMRLPLAGALSVADTTEPMALPVQ